MNPQISDTLAKLREVERRELVLLEIVDGKPTCAKCHAPMRKAGCEGVTLVGYRRGDCGRMHDDNRRSDAYFCENGHRAIVSVVRTCPCGWRGKTTCFCHPGEKFESWP